MNRATTHASPYRPLWGLLLIIVVFVVVMSAVTWSRGQDIIPWREDVAAAQAEAGESGRPLMLYFTASWCGPCQRMKTTTWADSDVEAALRSYVPVKIDIDQHPSIANAYHIEAVPTFIIVRDDRAAKAIDGYLAPPQFLQWLKG